MAVFKCKMCGGTIEFNKDDAVGVCTKCGTSQSLPVGADDKRIELYNAANEYRMSNKYDKAMAVYDELLEDNNEDAEVYWSKILCRYGIKYAEEPITHKRIPTVNRVLFASVLSDEDYESALLYANSAQKSFYKAQAMEIYKIQKNILDFASREKYYDVSICCTEKDYNIAETAYQQLTNMGLKVFCSHITLKDKIYYEREPYIVLALSVSKIMVVLGTSHEYFEDTQIRKEWKFYLRLTESDKDKTLLPAYTNMSKLDLPDELTELPALDISKQNLVQRLANTSGKSEVFAEPIEDNKDEIVKEEKKSIEVKSVTVSNSGYNLQPIFKRGFTLLEERKWSEADFCFDEILDIDSRNALAYLGKLMAELKIRKKEKLKFCEEPFSKNRYYKKILRYGDSQLVNELKEYQAIADEKSKNAEVEDTYKQAVSLSKNGQTTSDYLDSAKMFESLHGYKDSDMLASKNLNKAQDVRKEEIYSLTVDFIKSCAKSIADYRWAIEQFKSISGFKDADEHIQICEDIIREIEEEESNPVIQAIRENELKKAEKTSFIMKYIVPILSASVGLALVLLVYEIIAGL